jgi:phosphoglycolate phosphatase
VARFRSAFTGEGLRYLEPTEGAREALEAIDGRGGRTGEGKAPPMREHGIACYVGDHPLDMAGALAAGVPGVAVLTGNHDDAHLRAAGATLVVPCLAELLPLLRPERTPK